MICHRLAPWLLLAAVGCAGTDADVAGSGSFALDAAPLPSVAADDWRPAHAGCEGVLGSADVTFGIAEGAPDLVVAIGSEGVVCVDTYSSLESELTVVAPEAVDALWLGYMAALQEVEAFDDARGGEPRTQLYDYAAPAHAEPQPQPSRPGLPGFDQAPASAEPQPQPSDPTPDTGADRNRDATDKAHIDLSDELEDCVPPTDPTVPPLR